ncbi:MAG: hypothetical protein BWX64_02867 [Acidobacteria bacterium ADurb.Bin051]|nr:MAG: hypothetical protein BWX64_02867 [Acidobacteria bacterium ADurb.Bin051]
MDAEGERVPEPRVAFRHEAGERAREDFEIAGETGREARLVGKRDHRGPGPGADDLGEEGVGRALDLAEHLLHRTGGVDDEGGVERQVAQPFEADEPARLAVLDHLEVRRRQVVHGTPQPVADRDEELDEIDIDRFEL